MTDSTHAGDIRIGVRIEVFTVGWIAIEAAVSLGAGIVPIDIRASYHCPRIAKSTLTYAARRSAPATFPLSMAQRVAAMRLSVSGASSGIERPEREPPKTPL